MLGATADVSQADHGKTLTATIDVDFPYGDEADNASKETVLDLSDYAVTLTQKPLTQKPASGS